MKIKIGGLKVGNGRLLKEEKHPQISEEKVIELSKRIDKLIESTYKEEDEKLDRYLMCLTKMFDDPEYRDKIVELRTIKRLIDELFRAHLKLQDYEEGEKKVSIQLVAGSEIMLDTIGDYICDKSPPKDFRIKELYRQLISLSWSRRRSPRERVDVLNKLSKLKQEVNAEIGIMLISRCM